MNKAQKQVQQVQLDSEQKTIRQLQRVVYETRETEKGTAAVDVRFI